jgi:hypothetical protein
MAGMLFAATLIAALLTQKVAAQPSQPSQLDVQSVYLFDFIKFVRWPPGTEHDPRTICVTGDNRYLANLKKIVTGERIDQHPIAVVEVDRPEDESGCSILFVTVAAKDRLDSLLTAAAHRPMLTVSDIPGFLDRGGMIDFLVIDHRVRFSVNLRPVAGTGISLSSELLKVAVTVQGTSPDGGGQ